MTDVAWAFLTAIGLVVATVAAHLRISRIEDELTLLRSSHKAGGDWLQKQIDKTDTELRVATKRVSELELNQERPANKGAMRPAPKKRTVKAGK